MQSAYFSGLASAAGATRLIIGDEAKRGDERAFSARQTTWEEELHERRRLSALGAPFRAEPLARALILTNKALTALGYIAYPRSSSRWPSQGASTSCTLHPGSGRRLRSGHAPQTGDRREAPPTRRSTSTPSSRRRPQGAPSPSRHAFSLFMIAVSWMVAQPAVGCALIACATALAFIRVIGGVHYPRDVAAGPCSPSSRGLSATSSSPCSESIYPERHHESNPAHRNLNAPAPRTQSNGEAGGGVVATPEGPGGGVAARTPASARIQSAVVKLASALLACASSSRLPLLRPRGRGGPEEALGRHAVAHNPGSRRPCEGAPLRRRRLRRDRRRRGRLLPRRDRSRTSGSFEEYAPLDALGRCGAATACIGLDTMPTQARGDIWRVKPTRWHTSSTSSSKARSSTTDAISSGFSSPRKTTTRAT